MRRAFDLVAKRAGDTMLVLLCLAALATLGGKLFWLFDLLSHFQVYYFWLAVAILLANLVLRRKLQALVALALVATGLYHLLPYDLAEKPDEGDGPLVTAMLLNLNYANQRTAAVNQQIQGAAPDLLVLQEVTPRWRNDLNWLTKKFKTSHDFPEKGAFGIWVLSNFEVDDIDVQRRSGITFLHVRYAVAGRPVEVVALHPVPPIGGRASAQRNALLQDAAVYARGTGTRLAIGDLNCSPWSPHFKWFLKETGLRDSALGQGVDATWFPLGPFGIPIDHILISPDIDVVEREVGGDVGSDHRAVILKFRLGKGAS